MKYKEFVNWCNKRACDGRWSSSTAICCILIMKEVNKQRRLKRQKFWRENYEREVVKDLVEPTNNLIKEKENEND